MEQACLLSRALDRARRAYPVNLASVAVRSDRRRQVLHVTVDHTPSHRYSWQVIAGEGSYRANLSASSVGGEIDANRRDCRTVNRTRGSISKHAGRHGLPSLTLAGARATSFAHALLLTPFFLHPI